MISAVFSCMNRLENLRASLDSWVDSHHAIGEIVVVDWSSAKPIFHDPLIRRLCEDGKIKVVRVEGEKYFSLAKSYNLAFFKTNPTNRVLLKLDADYRLLDSRWLNHVFDQLLGVEGISNSGQLSDYFIVGSHMFSRNYTGFVLMNKQHFLLYNENMEGYGHDDIEMYSRMKSKFPSLKDVVFFNIKDYILHLPHSDHARVENYANKDTRDTSTKNANASSEFALARYRVLSSEGNLEVVERIIV
jgi:hypothetical protein